MPAARGKTDMITIVDYGVGNLFSLGGSFAALGAETLVTGDPDKVASAEKIILPGVGAFADAAAKLRDTGLAEAVKHAASRGTPLLGICLGMQLLFERSYEDGVYDGLALIPGEIRPIADVIPRGYKVPQIGWNALFYTDNKTDLFAKIPEGSYVYFVHSYYAAGCDGYVTAYTEYGADLTAAVRNGNVEGCQFHPEKSGNVGLSILTSFIEREVKA